MLAPAIAIDFGTTRTKIAYFDPTCGKPQLVELGRETRAIVPSIFHVSSDGKALVGDDAQEMLETDPEGIIIGLKKEIHKLGKKRLPSRPSVNRVELASTLFHFVRQGCREEVFHSDVTKCVLTVPVTFEEQKRECIRQAAELAGFREIGIVDEPTAAAKYWLDTHGQHIADTVVVCDVGGGTTDLALLRYREGHLTPVAEVPPDGFGLGGNDVDESIWDAFLDSIPTDDTPTIVEDRYRAAFLAKLRRIKELLTRDSREQIPLTLGTTSFRIPRTVVEQLVRDFVERVTQRTQRFLDRCQALPGIQEGAILLVGGASRLPGLKDALEQIAPGRVYQWNYSDYATVLGAVECPALAPTTTSASIPEPSSASANLGSHVAIPSAEPVSSVSEPEPASEGASTPSTGQSLGKLGTRDVDPSAAASSPSDITLAQVVCPHCKRSNVIAPSNVGKDFHCIHCGRTIPGSKPARSAEGPGKSAASESPRPPQASPVTETQDTSRKTTRKKANASAEYIHGLIGDGRADQAFDLVNQAMTTAPNETLFDLWGECASFIVDAKRLLMAARELHRVRHGDVWSSCCLADALSTVGRQAEAQSILAPFLADGNLKKFFPLHFEHLATMGSSPSAPYQSLLGRLLKRKPDHSTLLAIKAASEEKPEIMRSLLDRALKSNPYDLLALFLDAICEVQHTDDEKSDFARFRSRLQTLERIAPDHCLTRMARALLHIKSEDAEKAKLELDLALADPRVREEPDLASVAFLWRSYCYPEGKEQAARQDLGECLVRDPDNTEALEARGISLFEAGMWREAIQDFDRLLNVDRKHKLALEYRGYCRLFIGQHDASGSDFQTLAVLDAASAVARTGLTVATVRRAFAQGIDLGDDASRFFLWPDIPEDKLQAVVDSYAAGHVSDNTTILLIYDDTFWRGGGDGVAITESQLLWHDAGESCQVRQLSSIHNVRYKAGLWGNKLYVDSQPISLTYLSEASGKLLAKLLVDIANEQRWMDEGAVLATVG